LTQILCFHVLQVSAKKAKALLARAGKIRRKEIQETEPSSNKGKGKDKDKDKDKEMYLESLRAPSSTPKESSTSSGEPREPGPRAKEMGTEMGGNGEGKVAGDEKGGGKPAEAVNVGSSKGSVRTDSPGDERKGDAGQDTKKSGHKTVNSSDNITPVIATDNTTKPVADDIKPISLAAATTDTNRPGVPSVVVNAAPSSGTPTTTTDKKDDTAKEKVNRTTDEEKAEGVFDGKTTKPKGPVVADEGDVATPKRVTKELPVSPAKSHKEKLVPALGLTVPKASKNGSAPPSTSTVTGSTLSPLQKALDNAEDETLMERVARLELGSSGFHPQKEVAPPAHTDSDFECETAPSGPSTPKSRAGGVFSYLVRSDVALSDDDDFFLDCDSNASVSNFDGL
jgi:hypothetical protein